MLIPTPHRILVAREPIDFRKQIDGLAALVNVTLREEALSGTLFVFTNRRRDALKLLVWDRGGFVLIYKRLERGRFHLPEGLAAGARRHEVDFATLTLLLEGIDLHGARKRPAFAPPRFKTYDLQPE